MPNTYINCRGNKYTIGITQPTPGTFYASISVNDVYKNAVIFYSGSNISGVWEQIIRIVPDITTCFSTNDLVNVLREYGMGTFLVGLGITPQSLSRRR